MGVSNKGDVSIGIKVVATAEFGSLTALNNELRRLKTNATQLNAATKKMGTSMEAASAKMVAASRASSAAMRQSVVSTATMDRQITQSARGISSIAAATRGAALGYTAMGDAGSRVFTSNEVAMRNMGMSIKSIGRAMTGAGIASIAAFAPVAYTMYKAVDSSIALEDATYKVTSAIGATASQQRELTKLSLDWSTKGRFSARENMEAMYELSSAGANYNDILAATPGLVSYATATQSDLADSATLLVSALKQNGAGFDQTARYANTFTAAVNWSMATTDKMSTTLAYAGPVMSSYNNSIERQAAIYSTLYDRGLDASTVGTSLRMGMIQLTKDTLAHRTVLEKYGLTYDDVNPSMNNMYEILSKMSKIENFQDVGKLVGAPASTAWYMLSRPENIDAIKKYEDRFTNTNEAFRTANEQMKSAHGQIKILRGEMEKAGYEIFEAVKPDLMDFTNYLTDEMPNISKGVGNMVKGMLPGFKDVINDVKGLTEWFGNLDDGTQRLIGHAVGLAPVLGVSSLAMGGVLRVAGDAVYGLGMMDHVFKRVSGSEGKSTKLGIMGIADEICHVNRCSTTASGVLPSTAASLGLLGATGATAGKVIKAGGLTDELALVGALGAPALLGNTGRAKKAAILNNIGRVNGGVTDPYFMGGSLGGRNAKTEASLLSRLFGSTTFGGGAGLGASLGSGITSMGFVAPIAIAAATALAAKHMYDTNMYGAQGTGDAFGYSASSGLGSAGYMANRLTFSRLINEEDRARNAADFNRMTFGEQVSTLPIVPAQIAEGVGSFLWNVSKKSNAGDGATNTLLTAAQAIPGLGISVQGAMTVLKGAESWVSEGDRALKAMEIADMMEANGVGDINGLTSADFRSGSTPPDAETIAAASELMMKKVDQNEQIARTNQTLSEIQDKYNVTKTGAEEIKQLNDSQSVKDAALVASMSSVLKSVGITGDVKFDASRGMFTTTDDQGQTLDAKSLSEATDIASIRYGENSEEFAKINAAAIEATKGYTQSQVDAVKIADANKASLSEFAKTIDKTANNPFFEQAVMASAKAGGDMGDVTNLYAAALERKAAYDQAVVAAGGQDKVDMTMFRDIAGFLNTDAFASIENFAKQVGSSGGSDVTKVLTDEELSEMTETAAVAASTWFGNMSSSQKDRIFGAAGITDKAGMTEDTMRDILTSDLPAWTKMGDDRTRGADGSLKYDEKMLRGEDMSLLAEAADSQLKLAELTKAGLIKAADQSVIQMGKSKEQQGALTELKSLGDALKSTAERRENELGIDADSLNDLFNAPDNTAYFNKLDNEVVQYNNEMLGYQNAIRDGITKLPASFWKEGNIGTDFQRYLREQSTLGKEGSVEDYIESNSNILDLVMRSMQGDQHAQEQLTQTLGETGMKMVVEVVQRTFREDGSQEMQDAARGKYTSVEEKSIRAVADEWVPVVGHIKSISAGLKAGKETIYDVVAGDGGLISINKSIRENGQVISSETVAEGNVLTEGLQGVIGKMYGATSGDDMGTRAMTYLATSLMQNPQIAKAISEYRESNQAITTQEDIANTTSSLNDVVSAMTDTSFQLSNSKFNGDSVTADLVTINTNKDGSIQANVNTIEAKVDSNGNFNLNTGKKVDTKSSTRLDDVGDFETLKSRVVEAIVGGGKVSDADVENANAFLAPMFEQIQEYFTHQQTLATLTGESVGRNEPEFPTQPLKPGTPIGDGYKIGKPYSGATPVNTGIDDGRSLSREDLFKFLGISNPTQTAIGPISQTQPQTIGMRAPQLGIVQTAGGIGQSGGGLNDIEQSIAQIETTSRSAAPAIQEFVKPIGMLATGGTVTNAAASLGTFASHMSKLQTIDVTKQISAIEKIGESATSGAEVATSAMTGVMETVRNGIMSAFDGVVPDIVPVTIQVNEVRTVSYVDGGGGGYTRQNYTPNGWTSQNNINNGLIL